MNNKFAKIGEYNQIRSTKQNAQIMTIHKTMTNLVMDTSTSATKITNLRSAREQFNNPNINYKKMSLKYGFGPQL